MQDSSTLYENYRATKFFVALDALRCLSILAVVWHHGAGHVTECSLLQRGYLGVDFFFVISGFLITTLLLREHQKHGGISMRAFYMRRSLRIFPLYYAVLLLYTIIVGFFESNTVDKAAFIENLPYFLTYTSNLFVHSEDSQRVIFYFAWSLATEEQFYLVWPWIERFGSRRLSVGLAFGLIVMNVLLQIRMPVPPSGLTTALLWHIAPPICLGVLLAHVLDAKESYQRLSRFVAHRYSCLVWLSVLVAAILLLDITSDGAFSPFGRLAIGMAMTMVVASFVARQDHVLVRVSRVKPIVWIGTVSYGVYLFHLLSINVVRAVLRRLPELSFVSENVQLFVVSSIVAIAVASVSYLYFESCFNRLKEKFTADRFVKQTETKSVLRVNA